MIYYFEEVDDCIMAAYDYVKRTGQKMTNHNGEDTIGVIAEDGTSFMMRWDIHMDSDKRQLARQIHQANISVIDFINTQLLSFL